MISVQNFNLASTYSTISDQKPEDTLKSNPERKEFQAETRMLLDIVARSLYSDKEVSLSLNKIIIIYAFIFHICTLTNVPGIYKRTYIQC